MANEAATLRKSDNQSMRKSRVGNRYFRVDPGYDKVVYENTIGNWFRIIVTFIMFYTVVALFWWAVFSHGIRDIESATYLFIGIILFAWSIIIILIILGHFSNKNLHKAERLMLEVNEEKKKKNEEEEKKRKREEAKKEMKKLEELAMKDSLSDEEDERDTRRRGGSESGDDRDNEDSSEETPSSENE